MSQAASMIREARLAAGLTQAEMARRLGVTQPAIAALERPGSNPRFDTVARALAVADWRLHRTALTRGIDPTLVSTHLQQPMGERIRGLDVMRRDATALSSSIRRQ